MHAHLHTEDTNNETTIPMKRAKQDDEIREAEAIPIATEEVSVSDKVIDLTTAGDDNDEDDIIGAGADSRSGWSSDNEGSTTTETYSEADTSDDELLSTLQARITKAMCRKKHMKYEPS